jgi:hypothetical protein
MLQTKVTSEKVDYGWQLSNRPIVNLADQAPILKELADNINTVEAAKDFLAEIAHMYGMEKVVAKNMMEHATALALMEGDSGVTPEIQEIVEKEFNLHMDGLKKNVAIQTKVLKNYQKNQAMWQNSDGYSNLVGVIYENDDGEIEEIEETVEYTMAELAMMVESNSAEGSYNTVGMNQAAKNQIKKVKIWIDKFYEILTMTLNGMKKNPELKLAVQESLTFIKEKEKTGDDVFYKHFAIIEKIKLLLSAITAKLDTNINIRKQAAEKNFYSYDAAVDAKGGMKDMPSVLGKVHDLITKKEEALQSYVSSLSSSSSTTMQMFTTNDEMKVADLYFTFMNSSSDGLRKLARQFDTESGISINLKTDYLKAYHWYKERAARDHDDLDETVPSFRSRVMAAQFTQSTTSKCFFCDIPGHKLNECLKFAALTPQEKDEFREAMKTNQHELLKYKKRPWFKGASHQNGYGGGGKGKGRGKGKGGGRGGKGKGRGGKGGKGGISFNNNTNPRDMTANQLNQMKQKIDSETMKRSTKKRTRNSDEEMQALDNEMAELQLQRQNVLQADSQN